jgi:hypothetical protein
MPIPTQCPECLAVLNIPDSLAGKTVKCKECAAHVNVPGKARQWEEDEQEEEEKSEDRPRKKRAREAGDDRPRGRRKAKSDGPSPVLLAGVAFVVILVVGVAVGIVVVAKSQSNRNGVDPVAKGGDTTPTPGPDRSITPIFPPIDTTRIRPDIPLPVVIRPPLPAGWIDFQHPQKEYSVYVPNKPVRETYIAKRPPNVPPNTVYIEESWSPKATLDHPIAYGMSKLAGSQSALQSHYNNLTSRTNSLGPAIKMQVKPITWGGRQAIEMEMDSETIGTQTGVPGARRNKSYARYAIVGDKMYMFEVHDNGGTLTETERLAFFDSVVFGR